MPEASMSTGRWNFIHEQAYQAGESNMQADYVAALSEVAGFPDEIASLPPYELAVWIRDHLAPGYVFRKNSSLQP